ncbi:hypothetical protein N431DRAFT_448444 [Stipitochalara longipes BDJ]|nr:hypothetical protein N431DRAFT_448444 [Stipitochalara longipes BDJ]
METYVPEMYRNSKNAEDALDNLLYRRFDPGKKYLKVHLDDKLTEVDHRLWTRDDGKKGRVTLWVRTELKGGQVTFEEWLKLQYWKAGGKLFPRRSDEAMDWTSPPIPYVAKIKAEADTKTQSHRRPGVHAHQPVNTETHMEFHWEIKFPVHD